MKNKKLFAILTLVCFMFTLMPVAAFAEDAAATSAAPVAITPTYEWYTTTPDALEFEIDSVEDLAGLAKITQGNVKIDDTTTITKDNFSGKTVKLTANLTFADGQYWYYNDGTTVVDYRIKDFAGTFNGNGNTISGLNISSAKESISGMGLFTAISGTINDLTLDDVTGSFADNNQFGFLAATLTGSATNCSVTNVNITITRRVYGSGMMFGYVTGEAKVSGCKAKNVTGTWTLDDNTDGVGTLIGSASGTAAKADTGTSAKFVTIENCSIEGVTFNFSQKTKKFGGFVGATSYANINNCNITDMYVYIANYGQNVGGFVGSPSTESSFTNCNVKNCKLIVETKQYAATIGGFAGSVSGSKFINCSVTDLILDMKNVDTVNIWPAGGFIGNQSGTTTIEGCSVSGTVTASGTSDFSPVGGFIGRVNGDLTITQSTSANTTVTALGTAGGFVGKIEAGKSVTLSNCKAADSVSTSGVAGGLVGYIQPGANAIFTQGCVPSTQLSGVITNEVANAQDKEYTLNKDDEIKAEDTVCYATKAGYNIGYHSIQAAVDAGADNVTLKQNVTEDFDLNRSLILNLGDFTLKGKISFPEGTFTVPENHDNTKPGEITDVQLTVTGTSTGNDITLGTPLLDHHIFQGWCNGSGTQNIVAKAEPSEQGNIYHAHWSHSGYTELHDKLHISFEMSYGDKVTNHDIKKVEFEYLNNADAKITAIEDDLEYFTTSIEAPLTAVIQPKEGLAVGTYVEKIHVTVHDGSTHSITATVEVKTPSTSGGGFSGTYNYPVTAGTVEGAKVTFSDNNAVAGETVTITVTPDSGKQVDEVIVTDEKGNVITVSKVGDNKYSFVMPAGKVNVAVTTEAIDYDNKIVLQIGNQNVVVDGKASRNDVAPKIVGDRTLVPIRVIVEALGGDVDWNEATRTVTITIDGKVLKLVIDEVIPGFGQGATIMDSRTYVPVRYVAEYVGANVEWIAETQQIVILK